MTWPKKFEENILQLLPEDAGYFFEALQRAPISAVHLNELKPSEAFKSEQLVPWNPQGRLLGQRPSFILDPLFHAGAYYVQESSSQFLADVLKQIVWKQNNPVVLDLCAAPGGKTMHLVDALKGSGTLIANEIIKSRVRILEENLLRKGAANVLISNNDPADFSKLNEFFDVIVIDAPCSGEGLFRREPQAANEWSESAVTLCVGRQQRILADAIPALKPGGILIYATCTFNVQENEENVNWLTKEMGLEAHPIAINPDWHIKQEQNFMFRFLPHLVPGEGLFMAVLQKPSLHETFGSTRNQKKSKLPFIPPKKTAFLQEWLKGPTQFEFLTFGTTIYALPLACVPVLEDALFHLNIIKSGIKMGSVDKHGTLIPEHELGLSCFMNTHIAVWEIDHETAINYLKKAAISVSTGVSIGWNLITHKGLALGFAKVMPGRMNNYLPSELRIIKDTTE